MNYYEHHLGDYAQATSHLTFVEDAAYSRMLRKYYAEEKPLPPELRAVIRLVGARTDEEREAVETVLNEFFDLESDGWHNRRADREIAKFAEKREKAGRSARARWNATASDSDANASNKDANASKQGANAMLETESAHGKRNALQTPDTRHQTPEDQEQSSLRSDSSPPLALTPDPQAPADLKSRQTARIQQIATEAQEAYNRILAKPHGLLPACAVLNRPRIKAVEKALPTARAICRKLYGSDRVVPEFWQALFETAADDEFHSGRKQGGPGHESWKPDFEYLVRETTIAKLFDRAMSEGVEAAA